MAQPCQGQYHQYNQGVSDNVRVIGVIVSSMRGGGNWERSITIWQFEARESQPRSFPREKGGVNIYGERSAHCARAQTGKS